MSIEGVRQKVIEGRRITAAEALRLYRSDDLFTIGELASLRSQQINLNKVHYVRNIHINPTNLCINRCKFCAFSRSEGQPDAYALTTKDILKKIRAAMPIEEVHVVGGLHPTWPFKHYVDIIKSIKRAHPHLHVKAYTATEMDYFSRISSLELDDVLGALKQAGLDAMPGGGAEIFSEEVRTRLCPEKLTGQRWLEVMEAAHCAGIKSNATMLYGHVESLEHRVEHLIKLRELQDRTGGFQAFIPLSYQPMDNNAGGAGATGIDDLKTIAISRLVLDNIPHIKAYWVMLGEKLSQLALLFGADDLDGTIIEEKITFAAGGQSRRGISEAEIVRLIKAAGKRPVRRDALYKTVRGQ